ncbi:MAG: four helix bundle protein [bacterium]
MKIRNSKYEIRNKKINSKQKQEKTKMQNPKQFVRSSGSIGANYIEANESLSKKDFIMRVKISRKEAKESRYWLKLLDVHPDNLELEKERKDLEQEAGELMNILGSILRKCENQTK